MPKVLEQFEFKGAGSFGEKIYDWDTLLDGQIYEMVKDEDYSCKTLTIQAMVRNQAAKRGLGIRVSAGKEDGVEKVRFQAFELSEEEKENRRKASELRKAERATKKQGVPVSPVSSEQTLDNEFHEDDEVVPESEPEPEPEPVKPPKPATGKKTGKK